MAESNKVIYAAIVANTAIGATKFTAAALTGSSAMISEGIHPGFRSRAWLSSTRHDPEVVKTLKGCSRKVFSRHGSPPRRLPIR